MPAQQAFRVHVTKDYLKFSAAHFIAYPGFRERLHGHNYRVSVAIHGPLGRQGYVVLRFLGIDGPRSTPRKLRSLR